MSERLGEWRRQGASTRFRGHDIFYRTEGEGPALLCIHGFPTASWDWHHLWSDLARRFRVVAPDMLGFGFSAKPRRHDYSIFEQADLHEWLLRTLGIERVHVLAHDYGDTVAQELLARFEERQGAPGPTLLSCCFLNGGLFPEQHRPLLIQKLLRSPIGFAVAALGNERTFRRNLTRVFGPRTQPTDEELAEFWALVQHDGGMGITHRLIHYIDERRKHRDRWVNALRAAPIPLRLINGALDPVSGRHAAERYREVVPEPDAVILDHVGHYPQVEDPASTLAAFMAFHDRIAAG